MLANKISSLLFTPWMSPGVVPAGLNVVSPQVAQPPGSQSVTIKNGIGTKRSVVFFIDIVNAELTAFRSKCKYIYVYVNLGDGYADSGATTLSPIGQHA